MHAAVKRVRLSSKPIPAGDESHVDFFPAENAVPGLLVWCAALALGFSELETPHPREFPPLKRTMISSTREVAVGSEPQAPLWAGCLPHKSRGTSPHASIPFK